MISLSPRPFFCAFALSALCALANALPARAATFYVATGGNDSTGNPNDINKPYASIQTAAYYVAPGDSILLRGGTYKWDSEQWIGCKGTASARITIAPYNNETVVIDGSDVAPNTDAIKVGGSFITIRKLTVCKARRVNIMLWDANNVNLEYITAYDGWGGGLKIDGWDDDIRNSRSYSNNIKNCTVYNNVRSNQNRDTGWGTGVTVSRARDCNVQNCKIYNNWGEGISLFLAYNCWAGYNTVRDNFSVNLYLDNAQGCTYESNTVLNQGNTRYYRDGRPAIGVTLASEYYNRNNSSGQLSFPTAGCWVKNNNIAGCARGIYFAANYDGTVRGLFNTEIAGNTLSGSWWDAILVEYGPHSGSSVHNNTCRANGRSNSLNVYGSGVNVYSNTFA